MEVSRHRIITLAETGSTNKDAMRRALAGEQLPLWVSADRQSEGRGRAGRTWVSEAGNLHASLALTLCMSLGIPPGNGALLMVLAASASYIAVPAVIRQAIPEANPSLYFGMSLGLTFPFNILAGIPLYVYVAHHFLR